MRRPVSAPTGIMCVALLCASLAAQDALPRENAIGMVRGLAAGHVATVELVSQLWSMEAGLGDSDTVRVQTDDHGRFKAALLPGRAYTAWARVDTGDATWSTSVVKHGIVAREVVVLELDDKQPQRLTTLKVKVQEGWQRPIHVAVVSRAEGNDPRFFQVDLESTGEDEFAVPPLPRTSVAFAVRSDSGVQFKEFELGAQVRAERATSIALPALKHNRLAVRDIDTGKGVAGATLFGRPQSSDGPLLPIATTDADGCAEVDLVEGTRIIARDPSHAPAALQLAANAGGEPGWTALREGFGPDLVAHVGPGISLKGRLLVGGHPAPDSTLLLSEGAMHYQQKNSRSLEWMRRVLDLDAEGRFVANGVLAEFPPDVVVLLGRKTIAALPPSWRNAWPVVNSPVTVDSQQRNDVDFGDIDLDALIPVRIEIETADGAPAMDARVSLLPRRPAFARTGLPVAPVDRAGTCTLLIPNESQFGVLAECGAGIMLGSLATGQRKDLEPVTVVVRVKPRVAIEGRVVDAKGEPMEGVMVWTQLQQQLRGGLRAARGTPAEVPGPGVAAIFLPSLEGMLDEQTAISQFRSSGRTDSSGHFVLMVPDLGVALSVCANRVQVPLPPEEWPPKPVEIEMPSK